jgi:hypothetical protein
MSRSDQFQIASARLALLGVGDQLKANLLVFLQIAQSCLFNGRNMHEHISAAIIRLNKSKALGAIKPLHSSRYHLVL